MTYMYLNSSYDDLDLKVNSVLDDNTFPFNGNRI